MALEVRSKEGLQRGMVVDGGPSLSRATLTLFLPRNASPEKTPSLTGQMVGGMPATRDSLLVLGDDVASAIAGSSVLLLGDGVAVAIAWDPAHRPVPTTTAIGRAAHATQLLGLARRHAIAVHRGPELTAALATTVGAVPEATWPRLAEIIAATRARRRSI